MTREVTLRASRESLTGTDSKVKEKRCSLGLFCLALFIAYDPAFAAQQEIEKGKPPYQAILDGGASKLRAILLIVVATVLGMIPLVQDPFFSAMAISIMFGLSFAALVALIVVPALYALFFRACEEDKLSAGVR